MEFVSFPFLALAFVTVIQMSWKQEWNISGIRAEWELIHMTMTALRTEHFSECSHSCGKDYNDKEKWRKINQFLGLYKEVLCVSSNAALFINTSWVKRVREAFFMSTSNSFSLILLEKPAWEGLSFYQ